MDEALTRSARRRARDEVAIPELPLPLVLVRLLGVLALCGLAVLAVHAGPLFVAGLLAWSAAGLAWGWPRVFSFAPGWRVSAVLLVTGVLVAAAGAVVADAPHLRLVPVALAVGIVLTFLLQLVRGDGRPGLTGEVVATSAALGLLAMGAGLLGVARHAQGPAVMTVTMAGVAAAALADPLAGRVRDKAWLVPLAMVLGGLASVGAAAALGALAWGIALALGLFAGALSYGVRRVVEGHEGSDQIPAQLAAACASVLSVGALAYVAAVVFAA